MQRIPTPRLFWACIALAVTLAAQLPALAYGQEQPMTICHRTGSPANPWVFMTIDARNWPEYQAQGDVQATSLADCAPPPAAPAVAFQQQPVAQATPIPTPTSVAPTTVPTPVRTAAAAATPGPTIETAGVTASQPASAPDVSNLPKSGGEPNRPLLVLALLAIGAAGLSIRGLARRWS
jgi:hypothetical protein